MKPAITSSERLQLIGLLTLAQYHERWMENLRDAAAYELLGVDAADNESGHVDDALWDEHRRDADALLNRLQLRVQDPPQ